MMNLSKLVCAIFQKNNSLTHKEVVVEVLNNGYIHEDEKTSVSQAVHFCLMELVRKKVICRRESDLKRLYQVA